MILLWYLVSQFHVGQSLIFYTGDNLGTSMLLTLGENLRIKASVSQSSGAGSVEAHFLYPSNKSLFRAGISDSSTGPLSVTFYSLCARSR